MCRNLRGTVPTTLSHRRPKVPQLDKVHARDAELKARQKENFDRHHGARELPHLDPGDIVWMPDKQTTATVQQQVGPQSIEVSTTDQRYRRNRRHLVSLPCKEQTVNETPAHTSTTEANETNELRRSIRASQQPKRLDPSWVRQ